MQDPGPTAERVVLISIESNELMNVRLTTYQLYL